MYCDNWQPAFVISDLYQCHRLCLNLNGHLGLPRNIHASGENLQLKKRTNMFCSKRLVVVVTKFYLCHCHLATLNVNYCTLHLMKTSANVLVLRTKGWNVSETPCIWKTVSILYDCRTMILFRTGENLSIIQNWLSVKLHEIYSFNDVPFFSKNKKVTIYTMTMILI